MHRFTPIPLLASTYLLHGACDLYFEPGNNDPNTAGGSSDPTSVPPEQVPPSTEDGPGDDSLGFDPSLRLMACDDQSFLGVQWLQSETEHFRFHYLPGTAAEADILEIETTREQSYDDISTTLGISVEPILDVYLSPNRQSARAQGLGFGRAYQGHDRYEVVYSGADNSFEKRQYGRFIATNLVNYVVPEGATHMHMLSVGISETLDSANRNMHQAYAMRLNAWAEAPAHSTELEDSDIWGSNIGRAGSLVQFLVERYGWPTFLEIYRETDIEWNQGCYRHQAGACIDTASASTALLSNAVLAITGDTWSEVRVLWRLAVLQALDQVSGEVPPADRSAIETLLGIMDHAMSSNDAVEYRTIMDGFYCDWSNEDNRIEIARRVVESVTSSSSRLVAAYPNGIKNFDETIAWSDEWR